MDEKTAKRLAAALEANTAALVESNRLTKRLIGREEAKPEARAGPSAHPTARTRDLLGEHLRLQETP